MMVPNIQLGRFNKARYGLLLLVALLVAAVVAGAVVALTEAQSSNGKYDTDGDGLLEVSNIEQLDAMRYDLDGNGVTDRSHMREYYWHAYPVEEGELVCAYQACSGYELARDLDFTDGASYATGQVDLAMTRAGGWVPIQEFRATLDGNGYTISNLYTDGTVNDVRYTGLFGVILRPSEVRKIGLSDVDVAGINRVGGLVGFNNGGSVSLTYVTGNVVGTGTGVGGLVGVNYSRVSHSFAAASVSSSDNLVGGLVGSSGNSATISSSYATGTVTGNDNVGGLVGNNYNGSAVSRSYAIGSVTGNDNVGGLVGLNLATVVSSYWNTDTTTAPGAGEGRTTAELWTPTSNTGIYATWSPRIWDFGTSSQYPALKVDFNGDGTATAIEFGGQGRNPATVSPTPAMPTQVPGSGTGDRFQSLSSGAGHVCLLRNDGAIFCTGDNSHGQASPPRSGVFTSIENGDTHSCALRDNGNVACWGSVSGIFDAMNPPVAAPQPVATATPSPTATTPPGATQAPQPTPTAAPTATTAPQGTPTPQATQVRPSDPCAIVDLGEGRNLAPIQEAWTGDCSSTARLGSYGRYYSITPAQTATATITLSSNAADPYLYLRGGETKSRNLVTEDDDGAGRPNARITWRLNAGETYTIEATTYGADETGDFTLTIEGLQ